MDQSPPSPAAALALQTPPPNGGLGPQPTSLAIASLALSLISFVGFGLLASVPAVVCGHLGLRRIRRDPAAVGGRGLARVGLVLGYLNLALCLLVILLGLTWLPGVLAAARTAAMQQQSANQLRQISVAVHQYAADHQVLPLRWEDLNDYVFWHYDADAGWVPDQLLVPGTNDRVEPNYEFLITEPTLLADVASPGDEPYIQEREPYWNGGRLMLYVDGRVELRDDVPPQP